MIFYTNTSRIRLILHSLNNTHTYYFEILAYPFLSTLKRKKSYWVVLSFIKWACYPDREAIKEAIILMIWPRDPTQGWRISLGPVTVPRGILLLNLMAIPAEARMVWIILCPHPIKSPPFSKFFYWKQHHSFLNPWLLVSFGRSSKISLL